MSGPWKAGHTTSVKNRKKNSTPCLSLPYRPVSGPPPFSFSHHKSSSCYPTPFLLDYRQQRAARDNGSTTKVGAASSWLLNATLWIYTDVL